MLILGFSISKVNFQRKMVKILFSLAFFETFRVKEKSGQRRWCPEKNEKSLTMLRIKKRFCASGTSTARHLSSENLFLYRNKVAKMLADFFPFQLYNHHPAHLVSTYLMCGSTRGCLPQRNVGVLVNITWLWFWKQGDSPSSSPWPAWPSRFEMEKKISFCTNEWVCCTNKVSQWNSNSNANCNGNLSNWNYVAHSDMFITYLQQSVEKM